MPMWKTEQKKNVHEDTGTVDLPQLDAQHERREEKVAFFTMA